MNAWASEAGKLARYEHIGWRLWPQRRAWSFHSGSIGERREGARQLEGELAGGDGSRSVVWSGIPGLDRTPAD